MLVEREQLPKLPMPDVAERLDRRLAEIALARDASGRQWRFGEAHRRLQAGLASTVHDAGSGMVRTAPEVTQGSYAGVAALSSGGRPLTSAGKL